MKRGVGNEPRKRTSLRLLLFGAFVACLVVALALTWPSRAAAAGGTCLQTGMETVATDATDYPPGATVHVTGSGYATACDVALRISRPDGVVEETVAWTDSAGNFQSDYRLPPPPGVIGTYALDVLGWDDVLLASTQFDDANCTTTKSGNWHDATVWSCGLVPSSADSVTLNHHVTLQQNQSVNSITIASTNALLFFPSSPAVTLTVFGNWTNSGNLFAGEGTVVFAGTAAQTIGGSNQSNFRNMTINKSSGSLTLARNATVNGNLDFNPGNITTGANTLIQDISAYSTNQTLSGSITASATAFSTSGTTPTLVQTGEIIEIDSEWMSVQSVSGNQLTVARGYLGSTAAAHSSGAQIRHVGGIATRDPIQGWVVGNLRRSIAKGTNSVRRLQVGSASTFAPIDFTFASVTSAGHVTGSTTTGQHPNLASSGISTSKYVNRYWTAAPGGGLVFTSYSATLNFANPGDLVGSPNTSALIVRKFAGSSWTAPTSSSSTSTTATGNGFTALSDFAVGETGIRPTSTTVNCASPRVINQGSACTATVTDTGSGTGSTPTGTVSFSSSGGGVSPTSTSCTLSSGSCSVTLTGSSQGTISVSGSYGGDSTHATSSGSASITVNKRATSTAVNCAPSSVAINQSSSCTATVTDTSPGTASTPTGTVSFSAGAGVTPASASCTLSAGSCAVNFTGSSVGTSSVSGSYAGSAAHTTSSGSASITVNKRSTSTSVSCTPASVAINQSSTCTATVTDIDAGTKSSPAGSVTLNNGGAPGSFSPSATCTLAPATGSTSTCTATYAPSGMVSGGRIDAGEEHTCAVKADATLACWGYNFFGQATVPSGLGAVSEVTAGGWHTCAVKTDATLACWGYNAFGQATVPSALGAVTAVTGGAYHTCALKTDGTLACWGWNAFGQATVPAGLGAVTAVTAGTSHTCVLKTDATLACWGYNGDGQTSVPPGLGTVTAVSAGGNHTCAVKADATLVCWGHNGFGQATVPAALGAVTAVTGGGDHTCAVKTDATLACWGYNGSGQTTVPAALAAVTIVTSGRHHTCALKTDATLMCWGGNVAGQTTVPAGLTVSTGQTHTIKGDYTAGGSTHANSSETTGFALTVAKRSTSTTVSCNSPVAINQGSSCTATVSDTGPGTGSTPTGTVSFSASGGGVTPASTSCTLNSGSCSVSFTGSSAGTVSVSGSYGGDSTHATSSGSASITVNKRSSSMTVSCNSPVAINQGSTCTATVSDTGPGTGSAPTGTVSFSGTGAGVAPTSTSCTLSSGSCSVTLTGSSQGTISVTGSYGGDAAHATSSGNASITVNRRSTSTAVTCTPTSAAINQGSSCTATVSDTSPGTASTPTGTVSFSASGAGASPASASCTLSAGSCSVTFSGSSQGTIAVTGSYGGDAAHATSSGSASITVNKRTTSTAVSCSPSSVAINQGSTCTATITDTDNGTKSSPAGSVTLTNGGASGGFSPSPTCTLAPATGSSSSCALTYTPAADGTHTIKGDYTAGGTTHASSADTTGFSLTVAKRSSSTVVSCNTPVAIDQVSTCTATVSDTGPGTASTPAGTVSFSASGAGASPTSTSCTLSSGSCSVAFTGSSAGTISVTGSYGGNSTHAISSGTASVTVNKRTTSTVVTCAPASVAINQGTTCTATVADADAGTKSWPQGSVSFSNGTALGFFSNSCTLSQVGAGTTSACSVTYTPGGHSGGTHTITASYTASDSIHAASADGTGFPLTVRKRTTATTVSCTPASVAINQGTTCTATVSDTDAGTKSIVHGSVNFSNGTASGSFGSGGSCTLAQVGTTTDSSCSVTYTPSAHNAGTHMVTGSYAASDNLHANSSDATGFALAVTKRTTATTVTCAPASVAINQATTCTATVSDTDAGGKSWPQGSVSFANGTAAGSFGSGGSCALAQVSTGTTASCSVTYTPSAHNGGTHTITAGYTATGVHANSADATGFALAVTKRTTSTSVSCAPSSVAINEGTTCTATVADTDAGAKSWPQGSVSFSNGTASGSFSGACTLSQVGTGTTSRCSVTYTPSAFNGGTHTITASYTASDSIHAGSSDTAGFPLVVTKRTTTTTVSCAPASVAINEGTTCTAVVSDTDAGAKSWPQGSVGFSNGAASGSFGAGSCTLAQVGSGTASSCSVTYTPSAHNGGTHTIAASYTATGVHANSADTTGFALTVTKRTTATTVTCAPTSVAINQGTTCTATVSDTDAGTKSWPQGSVSFSNGTASGSFSAGTCTLAQVSASTASSCSVTYTPSAFNGGTHTIKAGYTASDGIHADSADNTGFGLTVTKRTTSTSVSCAPASVAINQTTTCTATVSDTDAGAKSWPQGSVSFSNGTAGGSLGSGGTCTLSQVSSGTTSSCSVTYTPSNHNGGTHTIKASYTAGDSIHADSSDAPGFALTVSTRTTATSVSCAPASVAINQATTCTATVFDTDSGTKSWPQGSVSFANGTASGSFGSGGTCALAQVGTTTTSSCSVTYTPSASSGGTHTITAGYAATGVHANSTDTTGFALTVTTRTTATAVACAPASVAINQATTCTATVSDTDAGGKSWPQGSVSFTNGTASGSFGSGGNCALAQVGTGTTSSCSVTYTPSSHNGGTHTIKAGYTANDGIHADSADNTGFALAVTRRTTSTSVTCAPASVPIDDTTTCTATVSDTDSGTKSWPQGSVNFSNGTASGSFGSGGSCPLAQVGSGTTSSCSVTYTPSASSGGTHTIRASYTAIGVHADSSDATGFALGVTKRTTSTSVTCAPDSIAINQATTCTAVVFDTDSGTKSYPPGSVSFSNGTAAGGFSGGGTCTLAQVGTGTASSCAVTYTPANHNGGTHTIKSSYAASDSVHADSADNTGFALTVSKRTTSTSVSCVPVSVAINDTTTCTTTVSDTDAGTKSWPQGSVSFSNGTASGSFGSGGSCTLAQVGAGATSSCSVTYTPSAYSGGTHTITGSYSATDSIHAGSADATGFALGVTKRTTAISVTCSPSSVPINDSSTCTAVVSDTDSGTKSWPQGSVSFSNGTASGSFGSGGSCTLTQIGTGTTSSCSVTYTPSAHNGGTHTIKASYTASDAIHANSSDATGFALAVTKRTTSTSVTCSPSSVTIGDSSTCTAVVTDTNSGTRSWPQGSLSFSNGTASGTFGSGGTCTLAQVGSGTTSSCSVTYTPSAHNGGTHTIKATYTATDSIHAGSADNTGFALAVTKRTTATSISCTPASVAIDQGSTCTATVSDTDAGGKSWPQGSVSFSNGTASGSFSSGGSCTLAQVGTGTTSSCSVTYTPSAHNGGTHTIKGSYTATGVHADSADNSGFALGVTKRTTSTSVSCAPASVAIDQETTCIATVSDTDAGTKSWPQGSVGFSNGTASGAFGSGATCTLARVGSGTTSSCSVTYTPSAHNGGTHTIKATYTATDSIHAGSADNTGFALAVTKRTTSTSVICSAASVTINDTTTCTATVSDADAGTKSWPQGSISFSNGTASGSFGSGTCTLAQVGTGTSSSCSVTYTPSAHNGGTHSIKASYAASDSIHAGSVDSTGFALAVTKRTTATSVTCSPASVAINDATTCTATVSDTDSGTKSWPEGSVSFSNGTASGTFGSGGTCSLAQVGTGPTASCSLTYTPSAHNGGTHTIKATYTASDSIHAASADNTGFALSVSKRTTATSLSCDTPVVTGQPSKCTATVSDTDVGTKSWPQGSVSFAKGAGDSGSFSGGDTCILAQVGTGTTSSCYVHYTPNTATAHTITASYSASDSIHDGNSTAGGATITVNRASTKTVVTSSANPSTFGQTVTFTATLSALAPGGGTPSGTVQFRIDGSDVGAPQTLNAASKATYSTSSLTAGSHTVSAVYAGNDDYVGSTAPNITQTVNIAPTTTTVTLTSPVQYSDPVPNLKATIAPASAGGQDVSGTVKFFASNGTTNLQFAQAPVVVSGGVATAAPGAVAPQPLLSVGGYKVTAQFTSSNANFAGSSSPPPAANNLTVSREDARATYTGALLASTGSINSTTANVTFAATVQDITATPHASTSPPSPSDTFGGDIKTATVSFWDVTNATPRFLCSAPVGYVTDGDTLTGTVTCNANLTASSTTGGTPYSIRVVVGKNGSNVDSGNYANPATDGQDVVNVYIPQPNFITGGGYLVMSSSSGLYPGEAGTKNNFGFNVKYNRSGTNLQGNINTIVRNKGRIYRIKGNAMTSLTVQTCAVAGCPSTTNPSTAVFNGKASIQDITNPLAPISIDGNATLQVTMTDKGQPGSNDSIAITVWNKSGGLWFSSNWTGTATIEQLLGGGNLSTH